MWSTHSSSLSIKKQIKPKPKFFQNYLYKSLQSKTRNNNDKFGNKLKTKLSMQNPTSTSLPSIKPRKTPLESNSKYCNLPNVKKYLYLKPLHMDHLLCSKIKNNPDFSGYYTDKLKKNALKKKNLDKKRKQSQSSLIKNPFILKRINSDNYILKEKKSSNNFKGLIDNTDNTRFDRAFRRSVTVGIVSSKKKFDDLDLWDDFKSKKLVLANVGQSKRKSVLELLNSANNIAMNLLNDFGKNKEAQKNQLKMGSVVDRFILKLINPDAVLEDFVINNNNPADKYKRFKMQLMKGKNKIYRCIQDVKRAQTLSDTMIKVYVTKIKIDKYIRSRKHRVNNKK